MTLLETGSEFFPEAWKDGGTVYCRLSGDLTVQNVPWARVVFNKLIGDHKPDRLIVDLRDVSYIDSAGLASLVLARKLLGSDNALELRGLADPVRGLLRIAQLDQLFIVAE